jgi:hypothetical protein
MDSVIEFITGKVMHTIEETVLKSVDKKYVDLSIMAYKGKDKSGKYKPSVWRNIRVFEDDYTYNFISKYIQKGDMVSAVLDVYSTEKDNKKYENYNIIRINKIFNPSNDFENNEKGKSNDNDFDPKQFADNSEEELKAPEGFDEDPFVDIEGDENSSDDNPLQGW